MAASRSCKTKIRNEADEHIEGIMTIDTGKSATAAAYTESKHLQTVWHLPVRTQTAQVNVDEL
jgi:hypothetical protein